VCCFFIIFFYSFISLTERRLKTFLWWGLKHDLPGAHASFEGVCPGSHASCTSCRKPRTCNVSALCASAYGRAGCCGGRTPCGTRRTHRAPLFRAPYCGHRPYWPAETCRRTWETPRPDDPSHGRSCTTRTCQSSLFFLRNAAGHHGHIFGLFE
jgi:hypothetical protein